MMQQRCFSSFVPFWWCGKCRLILQENLATCESTFKENVHLKKLDLKKDKRFIICIFSYVKKIWISYFLM